MYVYHVCVMSTEAKRGHQVPETGDRDGYKAPDGTRNLDPLQRVASVLHHCDISPTLKTANLFANIKKKY